MLKKFSLFLAKIFTIFLVVITGTFCVWPYQALAATAETDYAHLTFTATDPHNTYISDIKFYVYEQLTDINGQPVLGKKLASGKIDNSGADQIKIKNPDQAVINIAVLYYKNSKQNEKFTLWDQYIYGTSDQSYNLRVSSAKIVFKNSAQTLLKDQSFSVYTADFDAQGTKVASKKLYSGQKTGTLGSKEYYFIPGDYAVKVEDKDYFFSVNQDEETLVNIIYDKPGKTVETDQKATLNFVAKDPHDQLMTKVKYSVYEQLTDVNNNPVFGKKLGSGTIDETGSDTIQIKNSAGNTINIAVLYYLNSKTNEKFTLWGEHIYGLGTQTYTLRFSSAKIIIKDSKQTLLTDQSFGLYTADLNAQGTKVASEKLYSGQKTGVLGYKDYYFVPSDYAVKIADNDYFFTVNKDQETVVNITYDPPVDKKPAAKIIATLILIAKDPQGLVVAKTKYAVYEQLKDVNNNPVLGKKLASGTIDDTGSKSVTIKNTVNNTLNLAITYYQLNNEYGKFSLYNQTVTVNETKTINLPFSGAKISIAEPGGNIMKNYSFDLYAVLKDPHGSQIGSKKVLSSQKTGDIGTQTLYLIPNDYFITIKYINPTDPETIGSKFKINSGQIADFKYSLGAVKLTFKNITGYDKTSFKILKYRDNDYFSVGSFKTNESGTARVVLPAGEYMIDSKLTNSLYADGFEFLVAAGYERSFTFTQGRFTFRAVDGYRKPLSDLKVTIYKYTDSKQSKAFSGTTNSNGEVAAALDSGSYVAYIDTAIGGQKYQSKVFYVQSMYGATYEFVVSMARIYLQDNKQNNLVDQEFYIYNYAQDSKGNTITGKELGNYTTNNLGYYDINLTASRYIIKPVNATKIFPIQVEAEKLNTFYLTAIINPNYTESNPPVAAQPTQTINTPSTNTVYMASIYTNYNLYNKDTDHDTLADFEEIYIWHTDPYNNDTDGDGYWDNDEIPHGYNPLGSGKLSYVIWVYDKPRVDDLRIEQKEAAYLKAVLTQRLGYEPKVSAENWNTLINAFVYGGYTVDEIKHTIKYGPALVHPTIPAYVWRVRK